MLPKGLVLLISIALTTGVIKLAKKRILVQDMYSIETLAHVDTLCSDKTGTITEGKMKVQKAIILHDKYEELFPQIIGSYLKVRIIILQCKQFVIIMKYPIDLAQKKY